MYSVFINNSFQNSNAAYKNNCQINKIEKLMIF